MGVIEHRLRAYFMVKNRKTPLYVRIEMLSTLVEKEGAEEVAKKTGLSRSHIRNLLRVKKKLIPSVWRSVIQFGDHVPLAEWLRLAALGAGEQATEAGKLAVSVRASIGSPSSYR